MSKHDPKVAWSKGDDFYTALTKSLILGEQAVERKYRNWESNRQDAEDYLGDYDYEDWKARVLGVTR